MFVHHFHPLWDSRGAGSEHDYSRVFGGGWGNAVVGLGPHLQNLTKGEDGNVGWKSGPICLVKRVLHVYDVLDVGTLGEQSAKLGQKVMARHDKFHLGLPHPMNHTLVAQRGVKSDDCKYDMHEFE